jgi:hypothetical protein
MPSASRADPGEDLVGGTCMLRRAAQGGGDLPTGAARATDRMCGDAKNGRPGLGGVDRFVLAPGNGTDTICDLENFRDRIGLTAFAGWHSQLLMPVRLGPDLFQVAGGASNAPGGERIPGAAGRVNGDVAGAERDGTEMPLAQIRRFRARFTAERIGGGAVQQRTQSAPITAVTRFCPARHRCATAPSHCAAAGIPPAITETKSGD